MFIGSWKIDDLLTFSCNTHTPSTSAAVDADAVPGYRVYEDETGTPILTGSMAKLDDPNTTGYYSEQITLSAANGFEYGKSYRIRITGVVGGVTGVTERTFQVAVQQTGDSFARLGAPAGASVSADILAMKGDTAAILVDTGTTLDARIPAALISGRMDSSVGAMAANVMTAAAAAADLTTELQSGLATAASISTLFTTAMTESYNADGAPPTPAQALFVIMQRLTEFAIAGTTITAKKLDGTTTAFTLTLDHATTPTSSTRAT